jgi:hypothetical protein
MQRIDFQRNPGIPVFSFVFNIIDVLSATINSRNTFNICTQKRLKGTQKGPKNFMMIPSACYFHVASGEVSLSGIIYAK